MKSKAFSGMLHCILLCWSCFAPHIVSAQSESNSYPDILAVSTAGNEAPAGLIVAVPALPGSANAAAIVHDSGEFCIIPEAPISTQGKLGKLKNLRCSWIGDDLPFEIKIAANGSKVLIRTSDNFQISLTVNKLTGLVSLRLKGAASGQKFNISDIVELSQHGAFWFETITALQGFSKSVSAIPFKASYDVLSSGISFASEDTAPLMALNSPSSGSTVLGSTAGAKFAEFAWYATKVAAIVGSIVAGSVAVSAGITAATGVAAVLGFGTAIAGIYEFVKFKNPQMASDGADTAVTVIGYADNYLSTYPDFIDDLVKALKTKSSLLKSLNLWAILNDMLNSLLEKPAHALVNGMVLKILYTWPSNQKDLDTATTFLGQTVGYSCGSSTQYLIWTGDDTSTGGREEVTCLISEAAENLDLPASFLISAKAGWYSSAGGSGPASLSMSLENPRTGILYGPRTQLTISPGSQTGCANTPVGSATFTWNPGTTRITWSFN
jgi:hypothetical protein